MESWGRSESMMLYDVDVYGGSDIEPFDLVVLVPFQV